MPSIDQVEQLLRSLQGIISARVVGAPDGRPVEIHILASPELHPKQVVRNVESALSAGLALEVDRRIISVSQLRPGAEAPGPAEGEASAGEASAGEAAAIPSDRPAARPVVSAAGGAPNPATPRPSGHRLQFAGFSSRSRSARETVCEVRLRVAGREFTGSAEGPDTPVGRAEAAARAAFDALSRGAPDAPVALEGVTLATAHGRTYVLVSAQGLDARDAVPLVGAALLERSPEEAAVLAALQATNRWAGRSRHRVA
ncbi:MAG TPA: hypothetical protein VMK65_05100 [Longimicrobiales bacterium]|nr:hypothetical protein [Longimicrobiales bacterium]